jgi:UDP-N-acetylmuramoyl-tripeptide--D-alanyl-D-alanine ligase
MSKIYPLYLNNPVICTDTRKIKPQAIFFALKGANFNGNEFAEKAIESGCSYAVIDEANYQKGDKFILVEDVLKELQNLANYHRKQLQYTKIIALTGSNGKTTTKELIYAVLSKKYNVLATEGNLNNHIGVPLTLLRLNQSHQFGVIEMGANHQKEIAALCDIAQPDYGLITNIGKAHLEGFGGIEGVKKGKSEMYDYMAKGYRNIFINMDDDVLVKEALSRNLNLITYGKNINSFVSGDILNNNSNTMQFYFKQNRQTAIEVNTRLTGAYNFYNAMAAVAVGKYFKVDDILIKEAIEEYVPDNNRSQLFKTKRNTLILDAYNANPSSMQNAIHNFININHSNKFFILGDMLELGDEAPAEHLKIIELMQQTQINGIFIGEIFYSFNKMYNYKFFSNVKQAREFLFSNKINNSLILIKGSRGIKLEELTDLF